MRLRLGPFVVSLCCSDEQHELPSPLSDFLVDEPNDIRVTLSVGHRRREEWVKDYWPGPSVTEDAGLVEMRRTEWSTVFDLEHRRVQTRLEGPWPLGVDSLLRTTAQLFGLYQGLGLVLHSSSVERDGRAFVFIGRSGAGKSTAALNSVDRGARVLSDDMTFIHVGGRQGDPLVFSLPLKPHHGPMPTPSVVPLAGVFLLNKAANDEIRSQERGSQLAALLSVTTMAVRHPRFGASAVALAESLLEAVPVRVLHFSPGSSFWDAIESQRG